MGKIDDETSKLSKKELVFETDDELDDELDEWLAAERAAAEAKRVQEAAEREASLFNWSMYRILMKDRRQKLGYRDARVFARTIYMRTRVNIPAESYYKIESGKQGIKAEQFMALNIALWGSPWPEQIMALCVGFDWSEITSNPYPHVPKEWKCENAQKGGLPFDDIEHVAHEVYKLIEEGYIPEHEKGLYL